jgi:hypothetical protein
MRDGREADAAQLLPLVPAMDAPEVRGMAPLLPIQWAVAIEVEIRATGSRPRFVMPAFIVRAHSQTTGGESHAPSIDAEDLARCLELGAALTAGSTPGRELEAGHSRRVKIH